MTDRILILGGGFSGLFAARELRRRLGDRAEIELINEENYFMFQPLLPEVAAGSISAMHAVTPLRFLLKDVKVRKARVTEVDPERRVVTIFQGVQRRPTEVGYDHLIVAMGMGTDLSRTPGLSEHALRMKTLEDARTLRAHVIERLEHAEITGLPEVKREALTFCVVGGGFSGIETVGEMKELIDRAVRHYPNIDPSEIRVVVLEFAPRILNELPAELAAYAHKKLEARGIEIQLDTGVAGATGTALTTTAGERIGTRTIVATIGAAPTPLMQRLPLPLRHGRVAVDRTLAVEGMERVWSLGDCALIPMKDGAEARDDFAPPTAQFAVREARHLARNIAAAIDGGAPQPFAYRSKGALASLGAGRGVAEVFGVRVSGYPAWLLWRAYYLMFLPGLATRLRVLLNWIMDGLAPRSLVQIKPQAPPSVRTVHYAAGDRIFEAGNRADGFYTVLEGRVELIRDTPEGTEPHRREIGPGGHFGGRMILGEERRNATVRALDDTRCLVMDRDEFLALADGFDAFRTYFEDYFQERYGVDWEGGAPLRRPRAAE